VELIIELCGRLAAAGLDAGSDTIGWHLRYHHQIVVSRSTISRHLTTAGLVVPDPKKRPRSSYVRFEAAAERDLAIGLHPLPPRWPR
jgi:hypothetical protein